MRYLQPALVLLLALLLWSTGGCAPGWQRSAGVSPDLASFRAERLSLPEQGQSTVLVAVGDIMLSRYVAVKMQEQGDLRQLLAEVHWFLQGGDIVFGNLEGPITPGREIYSPEMVFRADPHVASALQAAGFNMLSLANNHMLDFGSSGLTDTMAYLEQAGIYYAGAGENEQRAYAPEYIEVNGLKIAFLAFYDLATASHDRHNGSGPGVARLEAAAVSAAVREAADNADFTVVSLHAGQEYQLRPDAVQINAARLAVDAGADLVLGSHPHVVQQVECYRGKYILYSLGNFVFDQFWSQETRQGIMAQMTISAGKVENIVFLPIYIDDQARPVPLDALEAQKLLTRLGLPLKQQTRPVWDGQKGIFTSGVQYLFQVQQRPQLYRRTQQQSIDGDGDGSPKLYHLSDGKLTIRSGSQLCWESPEQWWVDDFFWGDSDNDGRPELNLSVWKEGSFGTHRPFWQDEEPPGVKNHLFVFRWEHGILKPVWQSSNLDFPMLQSSLVDLNHDGENELLVTEGSYCDPRHREITLWQWDGWGFSRLM